MEEKRRLLSLLLAPLGLMFMLAATGSHAAAQSGTIQDCRIASYTTNGSGHIISYVVTYGGGFDTIKVDAPDAEKTEDIKDAKEYCDEDESHVVDAHWKGDPKTYDGFTVPG